MQKASNRIAVVSMHVIALLWVYSPPKLLSLSTPLSACLCIHAVVSYFTVCSHRSQSSRWFVFCMFVHLSFPMLCWTVCHHTFIFFPCAPLLPSVLSPSSLPPVLIWKCFGLQQMTVHIEITEKPWDQIIIQHHSRCNKSKFCMQ
ncbi:hypothetical protein CHARACLAT_030319 [Characodon lateralis]|uniref:Secreted protein n=1 Tax=Characodon lateralis TaxID=208331 RepID=A0ABU7EHC4_9TELE|nr:hypothetical protein [Characodon lateralis]